MIKNARQRAKVTALVLLSLILAAVFFIPVPTLLVGEQQGQSVLAIPMLFDKNLTYEYLHSVLRTPVQENFTLAPGNDFLLTSTTFKSLGVGTPFLEGEGKLENRNGLFVLKGQDRHFKQLNFGMIPFTYQAILCQGKRYYFKDYFKAGSLIKLEVKKTSLARILAINLGRR